MAQGDPLEFSYVIDGARITILTLETASESGLWMLLVMIVDGDGIIKTMTLEVDDNPDELAALEGMVRGDKDAGLALAAEALNRVRARDASNRQRSPMGAEPGRKPHSPEVFASDGDSLEQRRAVGMTTTEATTPIAPRSALAGTKPTVPATAYPGECLQCGGFRTKFQSRVEQQRLCDKCLRRQDRWGAIRSLVVYIAVSATVVAIVAGLSWFNKREDAHERDVLVCANWQLSLQDNAAQYYEDRSEGTTVDPANSTPPEECSRVSTAEVNNVLRTRDGPPDVP